MNALDELDRMPVGVRDPAHPQPRLEVVRRREGRCACRRETRVLAVDVVGPHHDLRAARRGVGIEPVVADAADARTSPRRNPSSTTSAWSAGPSAGERKPGRKPRLS